MSSFLKRRAFLATLAAAAPATLLGEKAFSGNAARMSAKAAAFLDTLTDEQRRNAVFPFDSEERENWHYIPKSRSGIPLKDLTPEQKDIAFQLLEAGLSGNGSRKARLIIDLEGILAVIENNPRVRDVGAYYFTVFGDPGDSNGWGWRFEGHHISVNITQVGDHLSATPAFWGANPAEVRDGALKGVRTLAKEEDLARQLAQSLHAAGKPVVASTESPSEYHTRARRRVAPLKEEGIAHADMTVAQQDLIVQLLAEYAFNFQQDIATQELGRIRKAGLEKIRFTWYGGLKSGERHYYRLQGPTFLLEYVNYQNGANHIHTAWRSFAGDYGLDALASR